LKTQTLIGEKHAISTFDETSDPMLTNQPAPDEIKSAANTRLSLLKRRQQHLGYKPPFYIVLPLYSQDVAKSDEMKNE
jgi:hypothetical protein